MSDQISNCGEGPLTLEEALKLLLVKRTSDGKYGLRAQVTNVASSAIQDGISCNGELKSLEQIFTEILTNSTIDGRLAIQFFNVTSV